MLRPWHEYYDVSLPFTVLYLKLEFSPWSDRTGFDFSPATGVLFVFGFASILFLPPLPLSSGGVSLQRIISSSINHQSEPRPKPGTLQHRILLP